MSAATAATETDTDTGIFHDIKRAYNRTTFMSRYGSEVWVSAGIIITFLTATTYYSILNRIEPIKADWENQKCHPAIIPLAGVINKPNDMGALAFTAKTFADCTYGMVISLYQSAVQPFYYMLTNLNGLFAGLAVAINNMRRMIDNIRKSVRDIGQNLYGRVLAITVPLLSFLFHTRSILEKSVAVFTTGFYTLLGGYITVKSLFMVIMDVLVKILIALCIFTAALFIIAAIPIVGAWAWPVAWANLIIVIAIMIPVLYIQVFMQKVLDTRTPKVPKVPGCFPGATNLETQDGAQIPLHEVRIGTPLKHGGRVIGVVRVDGKNQNFYDLDGVVVTGEHRVWRGTRLIKVCQHPEARLLADVEHDVVYCLLTEQKIIGVGEHFFCDWDEIDEDLLDILSTNAQVPASASSVHSHLESALAPDTAILRPDGSFTPVQDLRINDVLGNGAIVKGLVEVRGDDLPLYLHKIQDVEVIGSKNLHFLQPHGRVIVPAKSKTCAKLYHVLTTMKTVPLAGGVRLLDYNAGLDQFL